MRACGRLGVPVDIDEERHLPPGLGVEDLKRGEWRFAGRREYAREIGQK